MFRTEALTWQEWLWIIAGTSPVLIVGEVYRKLKSLRGLRGLRV
jgi:Ca2+-transporting ATPase